MAPLDQAQAEFPVDLGEGVQPQLGTFPDDPAIPASTDSIGSSRTPARPMASINQEAPTVLGGLALPSRRGPPGRDTGRRESRGSGVDSWPSTPSEGEDEIAVHRIDPPRDNRASDLETTVPDRLRSTHFDDAVAPVEGRLRPGAGRWTSRPAPSPIRPRTRLDGSGTRADARICVAVRQAIGRHLGGRPGRCVDRDNRTRWCRTRRGSR